MDLQWICFPGSSFTGVEELRELPEAFDGIKGQTVGFQDHIYTGPVAQQEPVTTLFLSAFELEEDRVIPMGFGGKFFYRVFLNGRVILDNQEYGNKPYFQPRPENFVVPVHGCKGKNLLAVTLTTPPETEVVFAFKVMERYPWRETLPTVENFSRVISSASYPQEDTPLRHELCQLVQNGVRMMRSPVFDAFARNPDVEEDKVLALENEFPILWFYEKALDRIKSEVAAAAPGEDEVCFWHLYNKGYIIKSAKVCFGIDISHRRGAELEPLLDFLLTTHNHGYHYTTELFSAMGKKGKPVISNFHPLPGFHRPPAEFEFDGVKIVTAENDHNIRLKKFVTSYYMTFHNNCTVFDTGDSHNVTQLDPPGKVDLFIVHPRVGLKVPEAVEKFHPACVLYSHTLEMGHCPPSPWYAVPFDLLDEERHAVALQGAAAIAPVWGEKLVWNTGKKSLV